MGQDAPMITNEKTVETAKTSIKQWCIALTGAVATGKSTVANILRSMGIVVIDADKLARDVVEPGQSTFKQIVATFGTKILDQSGKLDRASLRDIVMADPEARKTLERIIHPAIQSQFENHVINQKLGHGQLFFYEAALIFELNRDHLFRETWATTCDEACQLERLQNRSKLSHEKCLQIIGAQWSADRKAKLATRTIDTNCSLTELVGKVKELIKATAA